MLGTEKVVMEMRICDGAALLLWPCSEPQVECSIVERTEYYLLPIKRVFTIFKYCSVPLATYYFIKQ